MPAANRAITQGDFDRAARHLCSDYHPASRAHDAPQFQGQLDMYALPSGLRVAHGDFVTLRPTVQTALAERSVYLSILFQPTQVAFELDRRRLLARRGTATLMCLNDSAQIAGIYPGAGRLQALSVQIAPERLADPLLAQRVETMLSGTQTRTVEIGEDLITALAAVFAPGSDPVLRNLVLEARMLDVLVRCLQLPDEGIATARAQRRMRRARDYLMAYPGKPHSLTELAREAGVSVTVLKTEFAEVYGETVFSFLRRIRLERARRGIECEGWSVSQAAAKVGYGYASNFSAAFRRHYGYAPAVLHQKSEGV